MKEVKKNDFKSSINRKLNIKISNIDMKIILNKNNKIPKIKGSFLLDKNKIKNNILPSFTRKIFKTVSEY